MPDAAPTAALGVAAGPMVPSVCRRGWAVRLRGDRRVTMGTTSSKGTGRFVSGAASGISSGKDRVVLRRGCSGKGPSALAAAAGPALESPALLSPPTVDARAEPPPTRWGTTTPASTYSRVGRAEKAAPAPAGLAATRDGPVRTSNRGEMGRMRLVTGSGVRGAFSTRGVPGGAPGADAPVPVPPSSPPRVPLVAVGPLNLLLRRLHSWMREFLITI